MLGIRLEPELARRLDWLARATGRPKSDLAREAIRVNTILPGLFDTPMFARAPAELKARLGATVPFPARLGFPEEFAQLAETLITCGYLNGEDVRLDGAVRMAPR